MDDILNQKINNSFKENFIGDVIFDDNELSIIYKETSQKLRHIKNEWGSNINPLDYKITFIALINVIKEWDPNADALFDYIYKRLLGTDDGNGKVYNQICKIIDCLAENNEIFFLTTFQKRYYATLLSHAFSPISSTESFFNMCWEIYSKDLDFLYSEEDPVFNLIAKSLNNKFISFSSSEDDFAIGSNVYSLRAGIKGLAMDKVDLITNLIKRTISDIDNLFNNIPISQEKYYETLLFKWWKKKEELFGEEQKNIKEINHIKVVNEYSQIKAKYILDRTNLCIEIPAFRLQDNLEYKPKIVLKTNDKSIFSDELRVKGSGILLSTMKYIINLKDYYCEKDFSLETLEIEIIHADKKIYNSKNSLKRKFILFKDVREIYSNSFIPGQYYLFVVEFNFLSKHPSCIYKADKCFYSLNAVEGECLQSGERIIFFESEKTKREIIIHGQFLNTVKYIENAEEYQVIDGEIYVDLFEDTNMFDYGINYSGSKFKLNEFPYTYENHYKRFVISHLLSGGDFNKISVFKYSTNEIIQTINVIKFNDVKIKYDKFLYYGFQQKGFVNFVTKKYHTNTMFDINDEEVSIKFGNGELQFFPPKFGWRLDNEKFNYSENTKFWWKEMNDSTILEVTLPKNINIELFLSYQNSFLKKIENNNKFKIGEAIYSIAYSYPELKKTKLIGKIDNNELLLIANIYFQECFISSPINVDEEAKTIHWNAQSFIGEQNKEFILKLRNNKTDIINSFQIRSNNSNIDLNTLEDGYYNLKIVSCENRAFMKKEKILYESQIILGNRKKIKFIDKILCIKEVMNFDKSTPSTIRPIYIDNIKFLTTKEGFDLYSGRLFLKSKDGRKTYLDRMKDKNNAYIKVNPVRIELMAGSSFYMGYGLNEEDPDFDYDNEFCIDVDNKIKISKVSKNDTSPDYYFYEEVK